MKGNKRPSLLLLISVISVPLALLIYFVGLHDIEPFVQRGALVNSIRFQYERRVFAAITVGLSVIFGALVAVISLHSMRHTNSWKILAVSFVWAVPIYFFAVYCFAAIGSVCVLGAKSSWDYLYFSYVTFTTLGYGDLQPVGFCRVIAATQAICGYIFLGVFVASLVRSSDG